jgi:hypothetical protein
VDEVQGESQPCQEDDEPDYPVPVGRPPLAVLHRPRVRPLNRRERHLLAPRTVLPVEPLYVVVSIVLAVLGAWVVFAYLYDR